MIRVKFAVKLQTQPVFCRFTFGICHKLWKNSSTPPNLPLEKSPKTSSFFSYHHERVKNPATVQISKNLETMSCSIKSKMYRSQNGVLGQMLLQVSKTIHLIIVYTVHVVDKWSTLSDHWNGILITKLHPQGRWAEVSGLVGTSLGPLISILHSWNVQNHDPKPSIFQKTHFANFSDPSFSILCSRNV